jgi:hypothetical protein
VAHTVKLKQKQNMRTKILLASAAALAVGVLASNAQVYSANVVGYANVVCVGNTGAGTGFSLIANPFDDGNGNQLTNVVPAALFANKSQVLTWNAGTGKYNTAITKTSAGWNGNASVPPGVGFFVINSAATPVTNTFVGSVIVNVGSSVTNTLPAGLNLVSSAIPYAEDIQTSTNINLLNLANKSQLLSWNTGTQKYNTAVTRTSTGWNAAFPVSVGQGFFVSPSQAGSNWVETLNP